MGRGKNKISMKKVISFILCSRNDNYMGNPVGRLEIALNYLAENVRLLGREESVEVIVTDWGSEKPLNRDFPFELLSMRSY